MLRALINSQIWLSRVFDQLLPPKFTLNGNRHFIESFAPQHIAENTTVYDIGGGKNPYLNLDRKKELNARVVGLDIDPEELSRAPQGAYDETICTSITSFKGNHDADVVICQALLEHVNGVEAAFASISSILKTGGVALIFVPSRNAIFARLNLLLPQSVKKAVLHSIFPHTQRDQGFPAYYDKCTPSQFKKLAARHEMDVVDEKYYYTSSYFSFCFPAYVLWRGWVLLFHAVRGEQAAETFSMALQKCSRDASEHQPPQKTAV